METLKLNIKKHIDAKKDEIIKAFKKLKDGLGQEAIETKEMLETYFRSTMGKASKEELVIAEGQFQDLLKILGLGVFAVLPFAPVTIPVIIKLADKYGVDIIPDSFKIHPESEKMSLKYNE